MDKVTHSLQIVDMVKEFGYFEKITVVAVEGSTVTMLGRLCYDPEKGGLVSIVPMAVFGAGMDHIQKFVKEKADQFFCLKKVMVQVILPIFTVGFYFLLRKYMLPIIYARHLPRHRVHIPETDEEKL